MGLFSKKSILGKTLGRLPVVNSLFRQRGGGGNSNAPLNPMEQARIKNNPVMNSRYASGFSPGMAQMFQQQYGAPIRGNVADYSQLSTTSPYYNPNAANFQQILQQYRMQRMGQQPNQGMITSYRYPIRPMTR